MATQFEIECALMAGAVYQISRDPVNRIPPPLGWTEVPGSHQAQGASSFEAVTFTNGSQLVIAFAGTAQRVDWMANSALATGLAADQLREAALYYVLAKAANPEATTISFIGHSLGGGLAALMGVFFNRQAVTFDQAPFANSINLAIRDQLVTHLNAQGYSNSQLTALVPDLFSFSFEGLTPRIANVTGLYVEREVLHSLPFNSVGTQAMLAHGSSLSTFTTDLHSQALLTAFVQNDAFRQITSKLPDLLRMVFDSELYERSTGTAERNFIDNLVRHQVGVIGSFTADTMLNRFTVDLQKVAQDFGFSLTNEMVSKTLVAFAMQKYYEETTSDTDYGQTLFANVNGSGGINFDRTAVARDLKQVKGYNLYFQSYLNTLATDEQTLVNKLLPAATDWFVQAGANAMTADGGAQKAFMLGGAGDDMLTGGTLADLLMGNAGDDKLTGGGGNDILIGGAGLDTYIVGNGKDTVRDNTDGEGRLRTEAGITLVGGKAAGKINTWVGAQGETYTFLPTQAAQLGTLTIGNLGAGNEVRIEKFDLALARSTVGYLGIKLDNTARLVINDKTGGSPFSDFNFNAAALTGSSAVFEGTGKAYSLFLNVAAHAGETITLALSGLADKFKAIVGDSVVDANGAVIRLAEGQTQVSFALVQHGDVTADASMQLSASYAGQNSNATSNSWNVNLQDAGAINQASNGDQRAQLIGIEIDLGVTADKPAYNTYKWSATSWGQDGTLIGGLAEPDFSDVIRGTGGNDRIAGLGGNDALDGGAGNDDIDGGVGDDLIGGGAGSDNIDGGDGNDYINSSATLNVALRSRPTDSWSPPGAQQVLTQGAGWGIYLDTINGDPVTVWSGSDRPTATDADVVDAGAGNDWVIAGGGDDRVQGGTGADQIDGMGGNDVLEGGDGNDTIQGDGLIKAGFMNSLAAPLHGGDFLNGGAGDDNLQGGGGSDALYGGVGNDQMWGDASGKTSDADYLDRAFHGNDYMDGDEGDDYIEGGGMDDILYGGAGKDTMWGDTSADNVNTPTGNALIWGNDYLDGEDGDDQLVGGGKDDTLYGGTGNDALWGDQSSAALAGEFNSDDYLDGEDGNDQLIGGGKDDILYGGAGDDILIGDDVLTIVAAEFHGADYLDGEDGNDNLSGGGGDDYLFGGSGNDHLDGGTGADYMEGGDGDDTYVVDNEGDLVVEADAPDLPGGGSGPASIDNVETLVSYLLGRNLDNLTLAGTAAIDGTGNALANILTGNGAVNTLAGGDGNDQLDGAAGADILIGGRGDDVYLVDNVADNVVEAEGEGDDFVSSTVSFTLAANVERMQAVGGAAIDLTGNALGNALFGNSASNVLTGGARNDFLVGAAGNDVYVFNRGDGQDTIDNTDFLRDTANPQLAGAMDSLRFGAGITDADVIGLRSGDNVVLKIKGTTDEIVVANYYAADVLDGTRVSDHRLDRVEFANGAVWDQTMIQTVVDRAASNHAPAVATGLPALQARDGSQFTYTVPVGTITDPDVGDSIAYSATLSSGGPLPAWLGFDAGTRTFSGVPGAPNVGTLQLVLWGTDVYGAAAGVGVTVSVQPNLAPRLEWGVPDQTAGTGHAFTCAVSANAFADEGDTLSYSATLADGSALPSWLGFNLATRLFTGTPSLLGTTSVRVTATDHGNLAVSDIFDIVVEDGTNRLFDGTDAGDRLVGGAGDDVLNGFAGDDRLTGNAGNDLFAGGAGNDYLEGGAGTDTYRFGKGDGIDTVYDHDTNGIDLDVLEFAAGVLVSDVKLTRGNSSGSSSDLNLMITSTGDRLSVSSYFTEYPDGTSNSTIEQIRFADGTLWDVPTVNAMVLVSTDGDDILYGFTSDDTINGGLGNDTLYGGAGNDVLDGGPGNDILYGQLGNDTFIVGNGGGHDVINNLNIIADEIDTLRFSADVAVADVAVTRSNNNLMLIVNSTDTVEVRDFFRIYNGQRQWAIDQIQFANGTTWNIGDIDQRAVALVDTPLTINGRLPTLQAQAGSAFSYTVAANHMTDPDPWDYVRYNLGGAQYSSYPFPAWLQFDSKTRVLSGTPDAMQVGTYQFGLVGSGVVVGAYTSEYVTIQVAPIQNLVLNGTANADTLNGGAGNDSLSGLAGNDMLNGAAGNDTLNGGTGNDTMTGGLGDDVYVVDSIGDVVVEAANEGVDLVQSNVTCTLAANVEHLTLTGTTAVNGTGNDMDNVLTGNSAANVLTGGAGNDTYVVGTGDTTIEAEQAGIDTVQSAVNWTLAANVENLTLTGTSAVSGTGNASNNVLAGNSAANTLSGAAGDDQYLFNIGGGADRIIETTGTDRIVFGAGITAAQLTATRVGGVVKLAINASNSISFDYLGGGAYAVEQFEFSNGSMLDQGWLNALLPNLAPTATNLNAAETYTEDTARNLVDILVGDADDPSTSVVLTLSNVAAGSLNTGTAGVVTSTYNATSGVWAASGPVASVNALLAALTFTPAANFNGNFSIATSVSDGQAAAVVGSKNFTGLAVNDAPTGTVSITGTAAQDQTLTAGNTLADVDGLGTIGYQWKAGGVAIVGATTSTLVLAAAQVGKSISVTASFTDGRGTAESASSAATASVVGSYTGTAAGDTLIGTTGAEMLSGLAGNDTYVVNNAGDLVIESPDEGADLVQSSVSYTLTANVEDLTLTGSAAIKGTGNASANVLTGNGGKNVLTGGAGDDTYVVGSGDTTIEAAGAGTDTVQSAIAWTLATDVENLILTGSAAIKGTGNASDNVLTGNSGANVLTGGAGNDWLDGRAGVDSLVGGAGNDNYRLGRGYGADTVTENDATAGNTDVAWFDAGIASDQLWFQRVGNNLEVDIIGTGDRLTLNSWYLGNQYHVEQFKTSDGRTLLDSQVQNLVNAMAAFAPPAFGQTSLSAAYAGQLTPVIATNWQ